MYHEQLGKQYIPVEDAIIKCDVREPNLLCMEQRYMAYTHMDGGQNHCTHCQLHFQRAQTIIVQIRKITLKTPYPPGLGKLPTKLQSSVFLYLQRGMIIVLYNMPQISQIKPILFEKENGRGRGTSRQLVNQFKVENWEYIPMP